MIVGRSVEGRRICAQRQGDPGASRTVLVVGSMHGEEPAGHEVVRRLRARHSDLDGIELWTITTINPDGLARGTRVNARGTDLNRNFPHGWARTGPPGSRFYAGPRPSSEPETQALRRFVRRIRPDVSVWYHQPYGFVILPERRGAPTTFQRRYARMARVPARRLGQRLTGTAIAWQNARVGGTAFVVELRAGRLDAGAARRHARAVLAVGRDQRAPSASTSCTPMASGTGPAAFRWARPSASAATLG